MEKYFKPERLEADPNSPIAAKQWTHWIKTFENFTQAITQQTSAGETGTVRPNLLNLLINYVAPHIFEYIAECTTYDEAKGILESLYVKPKNEIFARHVLATRTQQPGESLDQFLQALKLLAKDCNFKAVTAVQACDDYVRDAFINGLSSAAIRQRLLENKSLDLQSAHAQALSLEMAQKHSASYHQATHVGLDSVTAAANSRLDENRLGPLDSAMLGTSSRLTSPPGGLSDRPNRSDYPVSAITAATGTNRCFFCGNNKHLRSHCPAKDALCMNCKKKGHFARVCRSKSNSGTENTSHKNAHSASVSESTLASIVGAAPSSLIKTTCTSRVNETPATVLIDTGSSDSFVKENLVRNNQWMVLPDDGEVSMANASLSSKVVGFCNVGLELLGEHYSGVKLRILPDLCCDIILGHDFLKNHASLEIPFGGTRPPLNLCGLMAAKISPPSLFSNLTSDCQPIAIKSRRYSESDKKFIDTETRKLLENNIIRPSKSPWRAQVLVTSGENHKRRMVVDYSQTINRFTQLDAYPLPRIDDLVNEVAQHNFFSTLDLRSAYHQVPLLEEEKLFTAFEAGGKLYEFNRIPFGVTNGVASFQRVIDEIIATEQLTGTYAYVDNVTICGKTREEHDRNLVRFNEVVKKYGLTLNEEKCEYCSDSIKLLGYAISNGKVRPDPDRLLALMRLPVPQDIATLRRTMGLFAHYSR